MKRKIPRKKRPEPGGDAKNRPGGTSLGKAKKGTWRHLAHNKALTDDSHETTARNWTDPIGEQEFKKLTKLPAPEYKLQKPPPSAEWDFRKCPKLEREMCAKYELSREVPLWRQMIHNYREAIKSRAPTDPNHGYLWLMGLFPYIVMGLQYPQWPHTPWLKLDQATRKEYAPSLWWSLRADPGWLNDPSLRRSKSAEVREEHGKVIVYPEFQIDLTQTDFNLKGDFSRWLAHTRKRLKIKAVKRQGVRSPADVLKALGVYRLLKVMPWQEVSNFMFQRGVEYNDQSALMKANVRAAKAIHTFCQNESRFADFDAVLRQSK